MKHSRKKLKLNFHLLQDDSSEKVHTPVNCFIPTMHLTDHIALASCLLNTFHVGDVIEEAVCFEKDAVPILSLKPSILQVHFYVSCVLKFFHLNEQH